MNNAPLVLFFATVSLIMVLFSPPEPLVDDMYPTTRYERCMVLYGDTEKERLCDADSK